MTREELINKMASCYDNGEAMLEYVEEYYAQKTCENCKFLNVGPYDICPIAEPLTRQYLDYDESTFSCNRWRIKDA